MQQINKGEIIRTVGPRLRHQLNLSQATAEKAPAGQYVVGENEMRVAGIPAWDGDFCRS